MEDLHGIIGEFLEGNIKALGGTPSIEAKSITENGTYNAPEGVDGYNPITVNVPAPLLEDRYINANGQYEPSEGYDGIRRLTVEVPVPSILPLTITENGVYESTGGSGFNPITVNVIDENIKMGNCFNQWVEPNMRVIYSNVKYFSTYWDGGVALGCQVYSNFDISAFNYISFKGTSATPHYYNPDLSDAYKIGVGFSSNSPTSYKDINYIETPNYYVPNDNEAFEIQYEIPNQTCYLVLNLGGWNLRDVQIELIKS